MKKLLLPAAAFVAAFTLVQSSSAQGPGPSVDAPLSNIRPRPSPSPGNQVAANSNKPFEASLSSDEKAKSSAKSMTSFPASTKKIYVHFEDDKAVKGQKLKVVWTAVDAKPYAKNKKITENSSVMPGPGTIGSYYLPADGLPAGKYLAQLSVDGKVVKDLPFSVTK